MEPNLLMDLAADLSRSEAKNVLPFEPKAQTPERIDPAGWSEATILRALRDLETAISAAETCGDAEGLLQIQLISERVTAASIDVELAAIHAADRVLKARGAK